MLSRAVRAASIIVFNVCSACPSDCVIEDSVCWTSWPKEARSSGETRPIIFLPAAIALFLPICRVSNSARSRFWLSASARFNRISEADGPIKRAKRSNSRSNASRAASICWIGSFAPSVILVDETYFFLTATHLRTAAAGYFFALQFQREGEMKGLALRVGRRVPFPGYVVAHDSMEFYGPGSAVSRKIPGQLIVLLSQRKFARRAIAFCFERQHTVSHLTFRNFVNTARRCNLAGEFS